MISRKSVAPSESFVRGGAKDYRNNNDFPSKMLMFARIAFKTLYLRESLTVLMRLLCVGSVEK
jgi:hypothetical protein